MDRRERMDSLEALVRVILPSTNEPRAGIARHAARAILASDWLRDTLAAERRAAVMAHVMRGNGCEAECDKEEGCYCRWEIDEQLVRNLEPEASDVGS